MSSLLAKTREEKAFNALGHQMAVGPVAFGSPGRSAANFEQRANGGIWLLGLDGLRDGRAEEQRNSISGRRGQQRKAGQHLASSCRWWHRAADHFHWGGKSGGKSGPALEEEVPMAIGDQQPEWASWMLWNGNILLNGDGREVLK
jgi:hypothetical protein